MSVSFPDKLLLGDFKNAVGAAGHGVLVVAYAAADFEFHGFCAAFFNAVDVDVHLIGGGKVVVGP